MGPYHWKRLQVSSYPSDLESGAFVFQGHKIFQEALKVGYLKRLYFQILNFYFIIKLDIFIKVDLSARVGGLDEKMKGLRSTIWLL